jgi:hypothetical protein
VILLPQVNDFISLYFDPYFTKIFFVMSAPTQPAQPGETGQPPQIGQLQTLSHKGNAFRNGHEVVRYLRAFPPIERYIIARELAEPFLAADSWYSEQMDIIWSFIEADTSAWQRIHTEEQFVDFWRPIREIALRSRKERNRMEEARRTVSRHWGSEITDLLWFYTKSYGLASFIRTVASKHSWANIVTALNRHMINRVSQGGQGSNRAKYYSRADFDAASRMMPVFPVSREEARAHGFGILPNGFMFDLDSPPSIPDSAMFVVPGTTNEPIRSQNEPTLRTTLMITAGPSAQLPFRPPITSPRTPTGGLIPTTRHRRNTSSISMTPSQRGIWQTTSSSPLSPLDPQAIERDPFSPQGVNRRQNDEENLVQSIEEVGEEVPEDEEIADVVTRKRLRVVRGCLCHGKIPVSLKRSLDDAKTISETQAMKLLDRVAKCEGAGQKLCWSHLKNIGSKLGLQTRLLNHSALRKRLNQVHNSRNHIGKLKTDVKTYNWFRKTHRPIRPSDALGIYRFVPKIEMPDPVISLEGIFAGFGGLKVIQEFNEIGTINIRDVFSWWWNFKAPGTGPYNTVAAVGLEEFEMYSHHLRSLGGRENYGWLRNSVYSQIQQVMRQDPVYYAMYVALRPDHCWRLITYPYYAKYARPGDKTFFRHIDINVNDLVKHGRGKNLIQGSVSLDNEIYGNCTTILPGMHKHIGQWWKRVTDRGLAADGFVHRISEPMFTKQDADDFGTQWLEVPCQRGAVRISLPHLPHGSCGPCLQIRRTILPWFVGIQADHQTLDTTESGTWDELTKAHRDLTKPLTSPSGYSNMYGAIPYRFPGTVVLTGLGPLSDALVGRRRWDDPAVLRERDIVLGPDRKAANQFILNWRKQAVRLVTQNMQDIIFAEQKAYEWRSYFYCKANEILPADLIDDDPPPDEIDHQLPQIVHGREE